MRRLLPLAALLCLVPALAFASEGHGEGSLGHQLFNSPEFWGAVVNFSLLVYLLVRFGGRPLGELLKNRRDEVERGIAEAAEMKQKAQARYDEYTARLGQLDDELARLRKDIEAAAEREKQKILADANETAARLKRDTEEVIARHAEQLGREVRREVVEAALAAAEELLRRDVTPQDQERLAGDFARSVADRGGRS